MKSDNELIAEFIGMVPNPHDGHRTWSHVEETHSVRGELYGDWQELQFNTSWDWLMPVVEKIESLGFNFWIGKYASSVHKSGSDDPYFRVKGNNKINVVYQVGVLFIHWYNQQNEVQEPSDDASLFIGS